MKNALLAVGVAAALYLLLRNRSNNQFIPRDAPQPPVDPRQARTAAQIRAVQQWIMTMIALYGNVKEFWQPGGIFYSVPREIMDDINIRPPVPGENNNTGWA